MRPRHLGLRLAAAAFFPLALTGCELPEPFADNDKPAAAPPANPPGGSWLIVKEGNPQLDELLPRVPAEEALPEVPLVPEVPHLVAAEPLDPRCVDRLARGKINPLDVDPGATTATLSWYHPADPSVQKYRITSISQKLVVGRQAELTWQEVEPSEGCRTLTTTVRGLQRNTPYVFSVDAVRRATWQNVGRAETVARSGPVLTR